MVTYKKVAKQFLTGVCVLLLAAFAVFVIGLNRVLVGLLVALYLAVAVALCWLLGVLALQALRFVARRTIWRRCIAAERVYRTLYES